MRTAKLVVWVGVFTVSHLASSAQALTAEEIAMGERIARDCEHMEHAWSLDQAIQKARPWKLNCAIQCCPEKNW